MVFASDRGIEIPLPPSLTLPARWGVCERRLRARRPCHWLIRRGGEACPTGCLRLRLVGETDSLTVAARYFQVTNFCHCFFFVFRGAVASALGGLIPMNREKPVLPGAYACGSLESV